MVLDAHQTVPIIVIIYYNFIILKIICSYVRFHILSICLRCSFFLSLFSRHHMAIHYYAAFKWHLFLVLMINAIVLFGETFKVRNCHSILG